MKACQLSPTGSHIGKCYHTCIRNQQVPRHIRKEKKARRKDEARKRKIRAEAEYARMKKIREAVEPSETMQQLIDAYRAKDREAIADFFRDVIAEEIREGCLVISGIELSRDPLLRTTKLGLDMYGAGKHEDDLLPSDESSDKWGKTFYFDSAYSNPFKDKYSSGIKFSAL